ncbi:MAG: helix-turn-helix transcriptional regulator [Pseudomonadota bacterium]
MSATKFLTSEEVSARYRGEISVGTLRNWRAMRIGPAYVKIGKAVLYPVEELEAWDRKNLVTCRTLKALGHESRTTPAIGPASPTG